MVNESSESSEVGWDCDSEAVELETGEQGNGMMGEVCRESLEASWKA